MRFLIFGCGYVGYRAALAWISQGHTVYAVSRSSETEKRFQSRGIFPRSGDVCRVETLENLPEVDVVLNAVGFDRQGAYTQHQVVVDGVQNVLRAITGRCQHFIQISSTSVYGQSGGEWVNEDSECHPVQIGGQLALEAERLALNWGEQNVRNHTTILRLAGIYGPGRLLSKIESLRAGHVFSGSGESWLNLIHVDDAVRAICQIAGQPVSRSTILNVVDNQPIQRHTYYELLAKLVGAPPPQFDPNLPALRGSGGINKRCSNQRMQENWMWRPYYESIESGLPASLAGQVIVP